MKYLYPVFLLAALSSCHRNRYAEISGTTKGFTSGTLIIKDQNGQTKFTGNIDDGKFDFHLTVDTMGYYNMRIANISAVDSHRPGYDIYLEPGTYTVVAEPESARQYPEITSSSDIQTSLSQYYAIANSLNAALAKDIEKYTDVLYNKSSSEDEKSNAHSGRSRLFENESKNMIKALQLYVDKYPQNKVEAHILSQLDYDNNANECYPIYQKFTDEQKKSVEGVEEGNKLGGLMNLTAGKPAPQITGSTPDGKPFSPQSVHGKITLIEFWTADNELSKQNHNKLLFDDFSPLRTYKNFAVVSVSLDTDPKAWKDAVKSGKLTWPNVSDVKGLDSPNAKNWLVNKVPTYMLVDGDWKIIERDVNFGELADVVQDYTDKGKSK